MTDRAIVDAGPLVALLDAREEHHAWAVAAFRRLRGPLPTCEPVVTEALHLLRRLPVAQDRILEWVAGGTLVVGFDLADECPAVRQLMRKYRDRPMFLADACLVRMSETHPDHAVCTLDADFRIYRKDGGVPVPVIAPDRR